MNPRNNFEPPQPSCLRHSTENCCCCCCFLSMAHEPNLLPENFGHKPHQLNECPTHWLFLPVIYVGIKVLYTLYMSIQVANFQRCEFVFHWLQVWVKLLLVLHLLLLMILSSTISHLFSVLQAVPLLACSLDASPCMPAAVLYYCSFQDSIL